MELEFVTLAEDPLALEKLPGEEGLTGKPPTTCFYTCSFTCENLGTCMDAVSCADHHTYP